MKSNRIRQVLLVLLAVVLLISGLVLLWKHIDYRNGQDNYSAASELVGLGAAEVTSDPEQGDPAAGNESEAEMPEASEEPDDPFLETMEDIDLEALREVNREVKGWITVKDTVISYPLMQGEDNSHYLSHTWDNSLNSVGAVFLDYRSHGGLEDFNSVIYGHNMRDGSIFGTLGLYIQEEYFKEHPYIYIATDQGVSRYDIFACYETDTNNTYTLEFEDDDHRLRFIQDCLERSVVDSGVEPTVNDRIITLSTCTGRGYSTRWVVQAVLRADG